MPRPSPRFNKPFKETREEGLLVPPPSALLMDHLWEMFGVRPALEDIFQKAFEGRNVEQAAYESMAAQSGIEAVLNYLQSLVDDRSPSKEG